MALDGVYLSLLRKEFETLLNGRVEKIHQPSKEEILISFRTPEGVKKLLINTAAGSARVHITNAEIENPKTPPMFCMLLRKHLSSGKLVDIRQDGFERILYFDFDSANELGDIVRLTLAAEIMGRRSNLILLDGEKKIIDSLKRVGQDISVRPVLPGMTYEYPPKETRLRFTHCTKEDFFAELEKYREFPLSKAIMKTLEGISPVWARECEFISAEGDEILTANMTENNKNRLWDYISSVKNSVESRKNTFVILKEQGGKLKDFCFTNINQYGELMEKFSFDSPSLLLDRFYSQRDTLARIKQKGDDLFKLLNSTISRTQRRVANQKQELLECADREKYRMYGDLVMANMYSLEKGQPSFKAENFYEENSPVIEIPLDKKLNPTQNAQKYYKEYRKLDTAEKKLKELIDSGEEEIKYLESVLDSLTRATTEGDLGAIREELVQTGYVKRKKMKGKPPKALPPMKFVSSDGYKIRVGRNNSQNDRLTCKESQKTDIWLHVKEITGSHVIISCGDEIPPDKTIEEAAQLAAYFSAARNSSRVDVDYTRIKNVKKPNGSKPGMVIFTENYTITVKPDETLAERLKDE